MKGRVGCGSGAREPSALSEATRKSTGAPPGGGAVGACRAQPLSSASGTRPWARGWGGGMEAGTLSLGFSAVPCKSGLADHTGLHPAASTLAHTRPPTPTPPPPTPQLSAAFTPRGTRLRGSGSGAGGAHPYSLWEGSQALSQIGGSLIVGEEKGPQRLMTRSAPHPRCQRSGVGVNGVAGPPPLSLASASCLQAGRARSGQPQDALLQRQVTALQGRLAELRAATEKCVPTCWPKGDRGHPGGGGRVHRAGQEGGQVA